TRQRSLNRKSDVRFCRDVRVIAIVLRSEKVDYRCHLRCENQLNISSGFRFIHHDHFGFPYGAAHIMCPVPPSCESPAHIILPANSHCNIQQLFDDLIIIIILSCYSNQFPSGINKLVQSLEMFKILGVNRVVVYKTNCSMETQRALNYYAQTGFVEEVPWSLSEFLSVSDYWSPEHNPGVLHYFGQIPALNDCLYRHMYQAKYVAMHDIDELILPQSVDRYHLLTFLQKVTRARTHTQLQQLINIHFNSSVTGVNILEHLYQEPVNLRNVGKSFKIIVNPQAVFTTSVHGVLKSTNGCVWVNRTIARMYHTRFERESSLKSVKIYY
uniref:Glycosyltransferase family 92 protein n=1 Tax=Nothobranchius furzeri TaxID=105023 RepID=A0A8C6MCI3_NOTFU